MKFDASRAKEAFRNSIQRVKTESQGNAVIFYSLIAALVGIGTIASLDMLVQGVSSAGEALAEAVDTVF